MCSARRPGCTRAPRIRIFTRVSAKWSACWRNAWRSRCKRRRSLWKNCVSRFYRTSTWRVALYHHLLYVCTFVTRTRDGRRDYRRVARAQTQANLILESIEIAHIDFQWCELYNFLITFERQIYFIVNNCICKLKRIKLLFLLHRSQHKFI